jgi:hypothetical protein
MNAWSYTSCPPYVFMAWCLVTHRDTFTFASFISMNYFSVTSAKENKLTVWEQVVSGKYGWNGKLRDILVGNTKRWDHWGK